MDRMANIIILAPNCLNSMLKKRFMRNMQERTWLLMIKALLCKMPIIKMSTIISALTFFVLACIFGCCSMMKDGLTVRTVERVAYQCENGDRISTRYYSLSDNSLAFVKLILPDGKEQTLSNWLSASGARHTDNRELVWWIKGDSAKLDVRGAEGNWEVMYNDCRALFDKK